MTTPSTSHATTQQQEEQRESCPQVGSEDRDFEENTPLLRETAKGNLDAVTSLLVQGANLNAQNIYGYTPLLTALANGLTKIALILLEHGASVHISTLEGLSALHLAAIHCDGTMLEKLLECGAFLGVQDEAGDTLLHWAIREEKPDILSFLLSKSTSLLDTQNEDGETPLHMAAAFGEEGTVETLLKNGATPDIRDVNGLTPAEHALENSHYRIHHMLSKGSKKGSNSHRHEPYRRTCGDVHGEYERKRMSQQHHNHSAELAPPAHLC